MIHHDIKLGDIEPHFWLTRSVARSCGISLTEAMSVGRLTPHEYSVMVTQCRASGCRAKCEHWLSHQTGLKSEVPGHCANAQILKQLVTD